MTEADLLHQFPGSTLNTVKTVQGETITLKLENGYAFWVSLNAEDLETSRAHWSAIAYHSLAEQAATASR